MLQPCQFVNVNERTDRAKCIRKGCTQPIVEIPVRRSTGKHWDVALIRRWCDVPLYSEVVLPPLYRRAWSFAKAWANYWRHGRPATKAHLREQRLAICKGCEFYSNVGCIKCGCPIEDKRQWLADKLSMATERCPVGKWGPATLAPQLVGKAWWRYLSPWG